MYQQNGASVYANMELEGKVMNASPHQLINMLFQGLNKALGQINYALIHQDVKLRGESTSRAISIIDEGLMQGLNEKRGGTIARDLSRIYAYLSFTLISINRDADLEKLKAVQDIVQNLSQAWQQIRD